ncbi:MAG: hypothetical protein MGF17_11900, partial [Trichodesmium sp. MAG_R04]|nr:hypothetical protein [Trichodesmium sp. MAG_R04]
IQARRLPSTLFEFLNCINPSFIFALFMEDGVSKVFGSLRVPKVFIPKSILVKQVTTFTQVNFAF